MYNSNIGLIILLIGSIGCSEDVTENVFGHDYKNILPVGFGDYNGDKRMDLFVLNRNFSSFRLYLGSIHPNPSLQSHLNDQCDINFLFNQNQDSPVKITGLNVVDFTGDGINDILLSFKYPINHNYDYINSYENITFISILKGSRDGLNCEPIILNASSIQPFNTWIQLQQEPLIIDFNGDMIPDLLGQTIDGNQIIWNFKSQPPTQFIFNHCPILSKCSSIITGGYVDIDGDFDADLVLVTLNPESSHYEIEIYKRYRGELKLYKKILLNFQIGQIGNILFLDMNLTGKDHVIVLPYCGDTRCQKSHFVLINVENEEVIELDVSFTDGFGNTWSFLHSSINPDYLQSINVGYGDYDLDGYPDLIVPLMMTRRSSSQSVTRGVLFHNVPCDTTTNTKLCLYPRTFHANFYLLDGYENTIGVGFFDSNENGLLDIIGLKYSNKDMYYEVFVKLNSPEYDSYFVKWNIISGICEKNCPPYGVTLPGGTLRYTTTNLNNEIQSGRSSQVFRRGFCLDVPGIVMGIGSSPNFIDTLTFGGISKYKTYTRTQIIPNSNLIGIPWKDDTNVNKVKWEMKQILRPKDGGILGTFHILVLIGILNAILIFYLHMKERRIDRFERSQDPMSMSALAIT